MLRSMTSYASLETEQDGWRLRWEVRSVNHRFLDIAVKLPDVLRFVEMDARSKISSRFRRGRVDCALFCRPVADTTTELRINEALARALIRVAAHLEQYALQPMAPLDPLDVLRWPGVLHEVDVDCTQIGTEALALLDDTIDQAFAVRVSEGRSLANLMDERLTGILRHAEVVQAREPTIREAHRQKLEAKLAEIASSPSQERLEQELLYWAQRMDVTEELDRIISHVSEFRNVLAATDAVGRRLDFLLQELNREANTLGSKATDLISTNAAVEIKVLIEQLREQVQNVE